MSHAYCMRCGAIISCGYEGCARCEGKMKPSGRADSSGFYGYCNDCYDKLPPEAKSPFLEDLKQRLSTAKELYGGLSRKIDRLIDERAATKQTIEAIETELTKYGGD